MFGGGTFNMTLDFGRLRSQLERVFTLMRDGRWRTLGEITREIGASSTCGVSARLRDLRKPKFHDLYGTCEVDRRRRGDPSRGIWEYRLRRECGK